MICINAEQLQDGLYNIKDGKIYKYKAKGGTVRTYDIMNIVRCKDCKYWVSDGGALMICDIHKDPTVPDHYCSYGEEDKDE
jgi:hypothetical protein